MDANQDILKGRWPELKGQAKQHWGKLTDDDIQRLSGKTEELASVLRQRYGYGEAQAEMEINNWLTTAARCAKTWQRRLNDEQVEDSSGLRGTDPFSRH